jgi:hypothetical protein
LRWRRPTFQANEGKDARRQQQQKFLQLLLKGILLLRPTKERETKGKNDLFGI